MFWLLAFKRTKRPYCPKSHPQNHCPEAHPKLLEWKTPLMKNMRMSLIKISSFSSPERSVKYGRIKAYPNGGTLPKRCSMRGKIKTKLHNMIQMKEAWTLQI